MYYVLLLHSYSYSLNVMLSKGNISFLLPVSTRLCLFKEINWKLAEKHFDLHLLSESFKCFAFRVAFQSVKSEQNNLSLILYFFFPPFSRKQALHNQDPRHNEGVYEGILNTDHGTSAALI